MPKQEKQSSKLLYLLFVLVLLVFILLLITNNSDKEIHHKSNIDSTQDKTRLVEIKRDNPVPKPNDNTMPLSNFYKYSNTAKVDGLNTQSPNEIYLTNYQADVVVKITKLTGWRYVELTGLATKEPKTEQEPMFKKNGIGHIFYFATASVNSKSDINGLTSEQFDEAFEKNIGEEIIYDKMYNRLLSKGTNRNNTEYVIFSTEVPETFQGMAYSQTGIAAKSSSGETVKVMFWNIDNNKHQQATMQEILQIAESIDFVQ